MSNLEDISLLLHVMAERIDELISDCLIEQNLVSDPAESLNEFDYCSKIGISSSLNGDLVLALSEDALKTILEKVFFFEFDGDENEEVIYNGVSEFLNLISANSTSYMESIEMPIEIGIPEVLTDKKIETNSSPLPAMDIKTADGRILLMFNNI